MAEVIDLILSVPATWGVAGAFIFAGPRWLACAIPAKGAAWRCTLEGLICLAIGAIAAEAFGRWALDFFHQPSNALNAVCAMIGLLANPLAPKLTEGLSSAVSSALTSRAAKILKGEDK